MDGVRRMEDEEACRQPALRIKHRWSSHSEDHDVISYFSRVRDLEMERLRNLTYVAPLTDEKGKDEKGTEEKGKEETVDEDMCPTSTDWDSQCW